MKTLSIFLFLTAFLVSCNRVEPEPEPLRTTITVLSPNPDFVIETDTATISVKVELSKNYSNISVKIGGQSSNKLPNGVFSKWLQIPPFSNSRIAVPLEIFSDGEKLAADTLRFVKFRLDRQTTFNMKLSRSNHASITIGNDILTFGGVDSYSGNAANSLETFHSISGESVIESSSLTNSRSGHGMLYHSATDSLFIFGGGKKQYAKDGTDGMIPTEAIKFSALNGVVSIYPNPGFYQDFGWFFDDSKLYIQGGVRKTKQMNSYFKIAVANGFKKELQVDNNISISEQILVQDPVYSNYLYFMGSGFDDDGVSNFTGFVQKSTGAIYFEPVQVRGARNEHTALNLGDGFVLLCGGFQFSGISESVRDDFELQDLKTGRSYWISTKLSAGRASHTMCKIGNNIYILGGYDQSKTVLNSIEKFTYQF